MLHPPSWPPGLGQAWVAGSSAARLPRFQIGCDDLHLGLAGARNYCGTGAVLNTVLEQYWFTATGTLRARATYIPRRADVHLPQSRISVRKVLGMAITSTPLSWVCDSMQMDLLAVRKVLRWHPHPFMGL